MEETKEATLTELMNSHKQLDDKVRIQQKIRQNYTKKVSRISSKSFFIFHVFQNYIAELQTLFFSTELSSSLGVGKEPEHLVNYWDLKPQLLWEEQANKEEAKNWKSLRMAMEWKPL